MPAVAEAQRRISICENPPVWGATMSLRTRQLAIAVCLFLISSVTSAQGQFRVPAGARFRLATGSNPLLSVTFSPDGSLLATAGYDNAIELWDVATGKNVRRWEAPEGCIANLVFSPNGHLLASGAIYESTVHLWDVATGKKVRELEGLPHGVSSLAFAPDGKILAAGGYGTDAVYLWEVASGKPMAPFVGSDVPLQNLNGQRSPLLEYSYVAFAPDGKSLASGHVYGLVRIWDMATRRETRHFRGPETDAFVHLSYAADNQLLVGWGETIRLWKTDTGKQPLFTNWGESMGLWKTETAKPLRSFGEQAEMRIATVALSPDGRMLASGSSGATGGDDQVHLWETATGAERCKLAGHEYAVSAAAFSPDGRTLASASRDGTAILWDVRALPTDAPDQTFATPAELEAYWRDLTQSDAGVAFRAIRAMVRVPRNAPPFLESRLSPLARADADQINRWANTLDNKAFKVREEAAQNLAMQLEMTEPLLKAALANQNSAETRRRLQQIMGFAAAGGLIPKQLQILRSLEILETIGTVEAQRVLEKMAGGEARFQITRDAKTALARLKKRSENHH